MYKYFILYIYVYICVRRIIISSSIMMIIMITVIIKYCVVQTRVSVSRELYVPAGRNLCLLLKTRAQNQWLELGLSQNLEPQIHRFIL